MKINKVLFTCNENAEYIGFWNSISKYFKNKMNIEPVLYFLGNPNNFKLSDKFGEIRQVDIIKEIPTRIQALWGKFYFTKDEPETSWLIGDLDLYHFDKNYFKIDEQYDYCHLNENGYYSNNNWVKNSNVDLPGYYHVAKGSKFIEIFNLQETFEDQVSYIKNSKKYGVGFNGRGWTHNGIDGEFQCCEENLSTEILRNKIDNLNFFGKTLPKNSRIDREQILMSFESLMSGIKSKSLVDMHCPRPYEKYEKRIEMLLDIN